MDVSNKDEGLVLPEPIADGAVAPVNEPDNLPSPIVANAHIPITEDHLSMADYAIDAGKGLLRGAEQTVRGIRQTAQGIGEATGLREALGEEPPAPLEYKSPEPQTILGKVTADVTSVALSYGVGSVAVKGGGLLAQMGKTAVGDLATGDPDRQRLSNLLEDYPWMKPAASLLAQNPTDPALVSKAKLALEDVLVTGAASSVFKGLHLLYLKASGKATPETIAAAQKEVVTSINSPEIVSPGATVKPVIPPRVIDEAVTLTPAQSAKYEAAMKSTVIKDALGTLPELPAGPVLGSQNPKYLTAGTNVLTTSAELGKVLKPSLESSVPGYRSMDETRRLAELLGQDESQLVAAIKTQGKALENIDVTALGGRQLIIGKSVDVFAAARKGFVSGDDESMAAFRKAYQGLAEVQVPMAGITTNLGRGLHAYGAEVSPLLHAMSKDLEDPQVAKDMMRLMAGVEGTAEEQAQQMASIMKLRAMSLGEKLIGVHNEYWTGLGLLSRATTQIVNLGSNAVSTLISPMAEVVGGVERGIAGKGWAEAREGLATYNGLRTSIFDTLKVGWAAMKTEAYAGLSTSAHTHDYNDKFISALTWNMNPDGFIGRFVDLMGKGVRMSFRALNVGDAMFTNLNYRARVSAQASREAVDMVKAGTLAKSGVSAYVEKALQDAINSTGQATNQAALDYAQKVNFVNPLKGATWFDAPSIGSGMANLASNPLMRGTILPFVKTPVNITRTLFDYTPIVGQLRKQFLADVQAGGHLQAMAYGKLTLGAGMYAGAAMLALDGKITGGQPPKGVLMPKGWQPYSAVFHREDGSTRYVSFSRLSPWGDVLGLTADFVKLSGMLGEEDRNGVAASMSMALANSITNKSYLRSLTEVLTILGDGNDKKAERWLDNHIASYVPGVVAQFNNDQTLREVRGAVDAMKNRIEGLSQTLPAKRDYFGVQRDIRPGLGWAIINPLNVSDSGPKDKVAEELSRLGTGDAKVQFTEPDDKVQIGAKMVSLKDVKHQATGQTAYDRMTALVGTVKPLGHMQTFHEALDSAINSARYKAGSDGTPLFPGSRSTMVKALETTYRDAARDQMMNEFHQELGITSPLKNQMDISVARKKSKVGIADRLLNLK